MGFWRRQWQPTPVLLPGKSHGQRSLVGCSPWGREELDTTEQLHFHFSLSCIGEGNGNPLQCSCLENPRDRGVWWAAAYGVAQSWARLKRLSSSSSRPVFQSHTAEPVSPPFYVMLLVWQLPTALWMPVLLEETQPAFCIPSLSVDLSTQGHPEKSG